MAGKKEQIPFADFIAMVDPAEHQFVLQLDEKLRQAGCDVNIEPSKSGYVVSYKHKASKRVAANYVFRKKGLVARIYADHVAAYLELLDSLPPALRAKVAKAPQCRRLINPELCSPHCPKGYEFVLDGQIQQKCRYNCFLFFVGEEANPVIEAMLERELACRNAAG